MRGVREGGVAGEDGLLAAGCEVSGPEARQGLALWSLCRFGREVLMSPMDCEVCITACLRDIEHRAYERVGAIEHAPR